ncbi:MAG: exodeoxyribonuclease VII small subunit [Halanaerobium sp.]|nr:MAG: exodeoxyribonuclease VII small subunit [Halanaerobium sp.]
MSKDKNEIEFNENQEEIKTEDLDFESALERLQKIVEDLEKGGLSLDKTLAEFSQGMKLLKFCHQKLDKAEKKIELMLKEDEEFTEEVPFDSEIEED